MLDHKLQQMRARLLICSLITLAVVCRAQVISDLESLYKAHKWVGATGTGRAVEHAYVDTTGQVHIVYGDAEDVQILKEKDQVSSEAPVVALDQETVGWAVDVPNCCTSYPIPTTLVIYRSGRIIQRIKDGLMIYKWQFLARGRQVAVSSGTVHGMNGIHLTLYDSRTGKRLKTWDGNNDEIPPKWGAQIAH